jgi:hypothetical protein
VTLSRQHIADENALDRPEVSQNFHVRHRKAKRAWLVNSIP